MRKDSASLAFWRGFAIASALALAAIAFGRPGGGFEPAAHAQSGFISSGAIQGIAPGGAVVIEVPGIAPPRFLVIEKSKNEEGRIFTWLLDGQGLGIERANAAGEKTKQGILHSYE